ncbi:MAG: hypothetical protein KatS3mg108_0103 [Isosphaeraceae bacterium]|nr:MAG: hypothetical protein KatS3mg108_0103 [Isosphaeraceae bacterium]
MTFLIASGGRSGQGGIGGKNLDVAVVPLGPDWRFAQEEREAAALRAWAGLAGPRKPSEAPVILQ